MCARLWARCWGTVETRWVTFLSLGSLSPGAGKLTGHYSKTVWGVLLLCGGGKQDAVGACRDEGGTVCANTERRRWSLEPRLWGELSVSTELPVGSGGLWEDGWRAVATSPDRRLLRWFRWDMLSRVGMEETVQPRKWFVRWNWETVNMEGKGQGAAGNHCQVSGLGDSWLMGKGGTGRGIGLRVMWEVGEFWTHSVGLSFRNAEQLSLSKDGYLSNWKCSWLQVAISRELHFNSH